MSIKHARTGSSKDGERTALFSTIARGHLQPMSGRRPLALGPKRLSPLRLLPLLPLDPLDPRPRLSPLLLLSSLQLDLDPFFAASAAAFAAISSSAGLVGEGDVTSAGASAAP